MIFWLDVAAFALKALILVLAVAAAAFLIARAARSGREAPDEIELERLDARWRARDARLGAEFLNKKQRKAHLKAAKKAAKAPPPEARVFVLDFKGDMLASAVNRLSREIDAVLSLARPESDEVVLRLESPGGTVTGYGLAAARLQRLRAARVKLTVCVDQVAASGGYMMAAVADRIVAAPFAMIGSIGVVAQIPNFNRVLKKNDIDVEVMTAGEFKRSVSLFGEITPAGREHFQGKLEETHDAFKRMVAELRPSVAIGEVGNGDVWLARDAVALGLVDEICVSDEYLFRQRGRAAIYLIKSHEAKSLLRQWLDRLGLAARAGLWGAQHMLTGRRPR
jgi:serine protease SohB